MVARWKTSCERVVCSPTARSFCRRRAQAENGDPRDTCYMTAIAAEFGRRRIFRASRARRSVSAGHPPRPRKGLSHADKSGMVGTGDDLGDGDRGVERLLSVPCLRDRFDSDPACIEGPRGSRASPRCGAPFSRSASGGR